MAKAKEERQEALIKTRAVVVTNDLEKEEASFSIIITLQYAFKLYQLFM
jgi:hypothetical protein